jgi:hypothetical protein
MKEFTSFTDFAEHLLILGAKEKILEHQCLEEACVEIETRAKEKFGEYQAQAGPFAAWAPLSPFTIEDRVAKGYTPDDPLLRSGEERDKIEHKVKGNEGHVGSDSDILYWLELGTEKMPARSTLGGAAFEAEPKIRRDIGIDFFALLSGGQTRIPIR